jgi:hypothetical protein
MTSELLGLDANGFEKRLHIHRPRLPDGVDELSLRDLRAAGITVSLRFTREPERVRTALIEGGDGLELAIE